MPKENENSKDKKPAKGKAKAKKTPKRQVDKIGKSKQLSEKLKTVTPKTTRTNTKTKNTEPRVCGNGKPMPSLAELERMFDDDSDEDENLPAPARCTTPDQPIPAADQTLTPRTLQQISNKMLDIISNLPDATILIEDGGPPPPVVPQTRKRKKNGTPYIVGCKERAKVVKKPKCTIGKGDPKYGVDYKIKLEDESDDESPLKRKRTGEGTGNLSKSIFNPQAEEIAAKLRAADKNDVHSDSSVDSNKTVNYEFSTLSPNSKARSFSPLPSTSNDKETFLKNDIRLNESLLVDSNSNGSSHDEVEIIEMPCETVIVDDGGPDELVPVIAPDVEEVKHTPPAPTFDSFIDLDMYQYRSIVDVDESFASDDCQIIDVDDVIAENQLIIDKYRASESHTVTQVQLNKNSTLEQPATVDLVQTSKPKETKNASIESVVNNFFQNRAVENTVDVDLCSPYEIIDLSNSKETGVPDDAVQFMSSLVKRIINSLTSALTPVKRKNENPRVMDTITTLTNLDHSSTPVSSNDSVICVSTSVPDNVPDLPSTSCMDNRPNSNSVIIDNSAPVGIASAPMINNCIQSVHVNSTKPAKKNPVKKKNKVVAVASSAVAPESPKGRSIGECPICMENLSNTTVASTICGHIFCMPCLKAAIKSSGKRCPTCRKLLRGAFGYHQLFL